METMVKPEKKPFLSVEVSTKATGGQLQRVHEQAASVANSALLLFAAAKPTSGVPGSSNALMPYLTPRALRAYASRPDRASSPLVERLYDLSQDLQGPAPVQLCFYTLYEGLQSVFAWVADTVPLRAQQVPGQPLAAALWPDLAALPPARLAAAAAAALADKGKLLPTAASVASRCGLSGGHLAALVPNISAVLADLHADLPVLQEVALRQINAIVDNDEPGMATAAFREQETKGGSGGTGSLTMSQRRLGEEAQGAKTRQRRAQEGGTERGRRLWEQPSNWFYDMPPNFTPAEPATMPPLLVPLVFHILQYTDTSGAIAPANIDQAGAFAERAVRIINIMAKPTNIQFFVQEVRTEASVHPYLLLDSMDSWLEISPILGNHTYTSAAVADWPRSINVFISSDSALSSMGVVGYSYSPGSNVAPEYGYVFMTWDSLSTDAFNSLNAYNDGPVTLVHEIFHLLGLAHTFGTNNDGTGSCSVGDDVTDTPFVLTSPYASNSLYVAALDYCVDLFWGKYGGDWTQMYDRASSFLGMPEEDQSAWADTCPDSPGYDELGNYMTYTPSICYAVVGHFTPGQAQRAHYITSEVNPVLYAWAQYYAQNAEPPPPQQLPAPDAEVDACKYTGLYRSTRCACKATWYADGEAYSYCSRLPGQGNSMWCEVDDVASCPYCEDWETCTLSCDATPAACNQTADPGVAAFSPPPPRPPALPPSPSPPPPLQVAAACRTTAGGCPCTRSWWFSGRVLNYCERLDETLSTWCQVSPTCPEFDPEFLHKCQGSAVVCSPPTPSPPPAAPRALSILVEWSDISGAGTPFADLDLTVSWVFNEVKYNLSHYSPQSANGGVFGGDNIKSLGSSEEVYWPVGSTLHPTEYFACLTSFEQSLVLNVSMSVFQDNVLVSQTWKAYDTIATYGLPAGDACSAGSEGYIGSYRYGPPPPTQLRFADVLGLGFRFFEAQMSGAQPAWAVEWRGDSHLRDGYGVSSDYPNVSLTGGWYENGGHLKISHTTGATASLIAYGALTWEGSVRAAGQWDAAVRNVLWAADYLARCHYKPDAFVAQIGDLYTDDRYWGRPETQPQGQAAGRTGWRPVYTVTTARGNGADVVSQAAAATAAAALLLTRSGAHHDTDRAAALFGKAEELYDMATKLDSVFFVPEGNVTSMSRTFRDDKAWAAAWLCRWQLEQRTPTRPYCDAALAAWDDMVSRPGEQPFLTSDTMHVAAALLMRDNAELSVGAVGDAAHVEQFEAMVDSAYAWWREGESFTCNACNEDGICKTPGGFVLLRKHGSAHFTANMALVALASAPRPSELVENPRNTLAPTELVARRCWARSQMNYLLGGNAAKQAFVVGLDRAPGLSSDIRVPVRPRHRGSACNTTMCVLPNVDNSRVLVGALVGGPGLDDSFTDSRNSPSSLVSIEYNAGFTGALMGLSALDGDLAEQGLTWDSYCAGVSAVPQAAAR